jgi:hypothetical protein
MAEENKLNAKYLFYNDNSDVQWGSATQLRNYIKSHSNVNDENYEENLKSVDDLQKEINLGSHTLKHLRDIGQYHYSLNPHQKSSFQADLMDVLGKNGTLKHVRQINKSYIWLLLVINTQTKMLYFRKLKSKKGAETSKALMDIMKEDVGLKKGQNLDVSIQVDSGGEFNNRETKAYLAPFNIRIYSSYSRHKASIVERVISTIRKKLTKAQESRGWKWIDLIDNIVKKYNNTFHRSVSCTPQEAEENFARALFNIQQKREKNKSKKFSQRHLKGDCVRVRVHFPGTPFKKGSHRQFSAEIYYIYSVFRGMNHAVYKLKNEKGEVMKGSYDDNDLIPAKTQEFYNVIVLKKRRRGKKTEALIKYDGFDDAPKWIPESELVKL